MNVAGIVVVSYNSGRFLEPCLQAAARFCRHIVVVDNASTDDSCDVVKRCPHARLIANDANRGFAAAVNQGLRALNTEFVLLLNPDAVLQTPLDSLIEACAQPGTAAAGGRLLDLDGRTQTGFCVRRFPTPASLAFESLGWNRLWRSNPVNRRYRCLDLDLGIAQAVEQPAGAFLMIRRSVWENLGGFDEGFFPVWFEEVDFLKRAAGLGCAIRYVPEAVATHYGAHSVSAMPAAAARRYWYDNLLRFSAKHFGPFSFRAVCGAVLAGVAARVVMGIVPGSGWRKASGYNQAIRLAWRWLLRGPHLGEPGGSERAAAGSLPGSDSSNGETRTQRNLSNSHSHGL
jgi:GT2 family glycosyltransferase